MDHDKAAGFTASPEALAYYIGQIVNPALDNFQAIAGNLAATASPTPAMLGRENLAGSTEFTRTCRQMLDRLFEAHHMLAERQNALVRTVTLFRDNLQQSSASYVRLESNNVQSVGSLTRQLETRLHSDGATG
jgi:alpha-galactosidase